MKTKKRQYSGWRRTTPVSRILDLFFAVFGRSPKQLVNLLEQDIREQAERLARAEEAIMLPLKALEPVPVPAVDDYPYIEESVTARVIPENYYRPKPAPSQKIHVSAMSTNTARIAEPAASLPAQEVALSAQAVPVTSQRRGNYGSMMTSSRVRRRVI